METWLIVLLVVLGAALVGASQACAAAALLAWQNRRMKRAMKRANLKSLNRRVEELEKERWRNAPIAGGCVQPAQSGYGQAQALRDLVQVVKDFGVEMKRPPNEGGAAQAAKLN